MEIKLNGDKRNMSPQPAKNPSKPDYYPELFTPSDPTKAREISLADYPDEDAKLKKEVRWEKETAFLLEKIEFELDLNPKSGAWILDYGCGLGRLAKPLCEKGYHVVGVELSEEMRKFAREYVNDNERFLCVSPKMLDKLVEHGLLLDAAVAVWCMYHCVDPAIEYLSIRNSLKINRKFLNVNPKINRMIPVKSPNYNWVEDKVDVWRIADSLFGLCNTILFPAELDPKQKFLMRTYMRTTVPGAKDGVSTSRQ